MSAAPSGGLGRPRDIGELIRRRVAAELGITASVGIAASKFVAKIASTRCKPDGLLLIGPEETVPYLHSLPVGALWGVGAKTAEVLARMGIRTVADLAATPLSHPEKDPGRHGRARLPAVVGDRPASRDPGAAREEHRGRGNLRRGHRR